LLQGLEEKGYLCSAEQRHGKSRSGGRLISAAILPGGGMRRAA
jgi:hypothetical protein